MISTKGNKCKMNGKKISGREQGFSLIAVLVLAMVGMAFVGGVLYTFESFGGSSRAAVSRTMEYNVLQQGVERGKAFLKNEMVAPSRLKALRYWGDGGTKRGIGSIDSLDDLLIRDDDGHLMSVPLPDGGDISENGLKGHLSVFIYDMQYELSDVSVTIDEIPPSTNLNASGTSRSGGPSEGTPLEAGTSEGGGGTTVGTPDQEGVYLVRAIFERDDGGGQKSRKVIETAVLQRTRL